jgi:dihydroorotate dehydrogenase electron transfer subunit
MIQTKAEALHLTKVAKDIYVLRILSPEISKQALPGQFVHVKCGDDKDFILRRPFSIHKVESGSFDILFQVVGRGTAWLSNVRPHTFLDVLGPIGNGFRVKENLKTGMIVTGGIGIAPLFFLADELIHQRTKLFTAMGAFSKDQLLYYMDMKRISYKILVATEDGSFGVQGTVADLIPEVFESTEIQQVYACGPNAMLKKVAEICASFNVACSVSLDERMGCGVGACLGCACKVRSGQGEDFEYKRVCIDGPVFDAAEVIWD